MQTKLIKANDSNINETALLAGEILRNGGIVAIPTETVYGLAANALSGEAVRIYQRSRRSLRAYPTKRAALPKGSGRDLSP